MFYWDKLNRTVRIVGDVMRVSREQSERYFSSRPRDSQLAAWASDQSGLLKTRADLEARFAQHEEQFANEAVPTPPFWGGYRLLPRQVEFWQGQPSRMHDRLRYDRQRDGTWTRCTWRRDDVYNDERRSFLERLQSSRNQSLIDRREAAPCSAPSPSQGEGWGEGRWLVNLAPSCVQQRSW